jgi:type IV pilus assembly protein PilM
MPARLFGLDIGRSFIKVVEVSVNGNMRTLKAAGSILCPAGGMQSESPLDLSKVSDTIKACVEKAKVDIDGCAVSLIESQVVSRLIQLPNLTDKELSAAISWEAEQYIPLPLKDVNLQYKVVKRAEGATGKLDVLLTAAPKRVIEKYLNVVRNAGLKPVALETESAALTRAYVKPADPTSIIVSMGALSTELIVASNGNVLFTRSIATGGATLTRAIMAEFNLPQSQAEEYKQTYGILEDKLSGKVAAVLKPILDIIIAEITKAVEFVHTHVDQVEVASVIITGGGAYLPGFSEFLVSRTSLEVSLGDPWSGFAKAGLINDLAGQGSFYSVATGLALRT